MVLPLYDDNPLTRPVLPVVSWGLIAVTVVVYMIELGAPADVVREMTAMFGVRPSAILGGAPARAQFWPEATLVTYVFLHGSLSHLFGNMIFLWVFGDDVEHAMGPLRFLLFYFACGIAAALAVVVTEPKSVTSLIGASGAVSGVVIAYLMLRPCAKITVLVLGYLIRVGAYWVIGFWVLWQLWHIAMPSDGIAYWAHIGGLLAGALLFIVMRRKGVALFQCSPPDEAAEGGLSSR